MSASLPTSSVPTRSKIPAILAASRVIEAMASLRVNALLGAGAAPMGRLLLGIFRVIGADGNGDRGFFQNGGVVHALVGQLWLAAVPKDGAGDDLRAVLCQQIGDAVGLGAVDDDVFQAELLGDADSRGNVVRPVGVEVGGQFPTDDRDQRLQL